MTRGVGGVWVALMAGCGRHVVAAGARGGSTAAAGGKSDAATFLKKSFHHGSDDGSPAATLLVRHPLPERGSWPFMSADFAREDEKADGEFYVSPRLVQHIDGGARAAWTQYLGETFLRQGAEASTVAVGGPSPAVSSVDILDLCSSWVSHLPLNPQVRFGRVIGQGMNPAELDANPNLTEVIVRDLNKEPNLKEIPSNSLDAVIVCPHRFVRRLFLHRPTIACASVCVGGCHGGPTLTCLLARSPLFSLPPWMSWQCTVSIDYLIHPQEVLAEALRVLKPGGSVHLGFSNRYFPTKVIAVWRDTTDYGRLWIAATYLQHAGFTMVEAKELPTTETDPYFVASGVKNPISHAEL
jgi:SAM-dependent methyltransferase